MTNPVDLLTAGLAGRYAIERELGAGGMATVYLAEDLKHHRKVALKVLRPELAAKPLWARDGREIFFRQAGGYLARRAVSEAPDLRLGAVERLFDARGFRSDHYHRAYDIAPDGRRFIMVGRQGPVSELVLVTNWSDELKAKVPR